MWKFIVPAIGLLVLIVVAMVMVSGRSDPSTGASSADKMIKMDLPKDLPAMVRENDSGSDVSDSYRRAIDLYIEKTDFLKTNPPPKDLIETLVQLIERSRSGTVPMGWADKYSPLSPGAQPKWYEAPKAIADIVLRVEVESKITPSGEFTGSKPAARKAIDAVFLFGQRVYESNKRVLIRRDGLKAMEAALRLRELVLEDKDARKWRDAIGSLQIRWEQKLGTLYKFDGSIADMVRFAELDQDVGFRVEAILQLGLAQWTKRSVGNARVATASLESLKAAKDPLVAEAAKAALAIKREDVHKAF